MSDIDQGSFDVRYVPNADINGCEVAIRVEPIGVDSDARVQRKSKANGFLPGRALAPL
jgi:hypothetical protein